eukprot:Platyproteum_vivax@DN9029_c0_g1_i1.p1
MIVATPSVENQCALQIQPSSIALVVENKLTSETFLREAWKNSYEGWIRIPEWSQLYNQTIGVNVCFESLMLEPIEYPRFTLDNDYRRKLSGDGHLRSLSSCPVIPELLANRTMVGISGFNPCGKLQSQSANIKANRRLFMDLLSLQASSRFTEEPLIHSSFGCDTNGFREESFSVWLAEDDVNFGLGKLLKLAAKYEQGAIYRTAVHDETESVFYRKTIGVKLDNVNSESFMQPMSPMKYSCLVETTTRIAGEAAAAMLRLECPIDYSDLSDRCFGYGYDLNSRQFNQFNHQFDELKIELNR